MTMTQVRESEQRARLAQAKADAALLNVRIAMLDYVRASLFGVMNTYPDTDSSDGVPVYRDAEEQRAQIVFAEAQKRWRDAVNYFIDLGKPEYESFLAARARHPDLLNQYDMASDDLQRVRDRIRADFEAERVRRIQARTAAIKAETKKRTGQGR